MKLKRSQKVSPRQAKPTVGRSLSTNSYYRPKSRPAQNLNAEKKQDNSTKRLKINWLKPTTIVNGLIAFIFLALFFFATTLSSTPDVKFTDDSYLYRDKTVYSDSAGDILSESILNKSKIFFKSGNFESQMQQMFPEISYVEAIVPLGGRDLTVSMQLSTPLATVSNGSSKGVMNSNGILITDTIPVDADELFNIRFATPQDNFQAGSGLLTSSEVELLSLLSSELEGLELEGLDSPLTIKEALFNVSDGQFEVTFNEVPYFIKLSAYADSAEQVGATKVTLKELYDIDQPPTKYVDVRVPGRVFVI